MGPVDHPRERGKKHLAPSGPRDSGGSSPRARGTGELDRGERSRVGIIPASAGKSTSRRAGLETVGDHPRERGEQVLQGTARTAADGSSPRARGTARRDADPHPCRGIIPASAGNRPLRPAPRILGTDHPRERGEQSPALIAASHSWGSSPRARGTAVCDEDDGSARGIIPASAGNSSGGCGGRGWRGDHPRERGEQQWWMWWARMEGGSSPRARGTGHRGRRHLHRTGIIPASAGNRSGAGARRVRPRDHPRERGEQERCWCETSPPEGSSPRARGTVSQARLGAVPPGSSPRARGTAHLGRLDARPEGIIPASAGNRTP